MKRFLFSLLIVCYIGLLIWGLTLYHVISWNVRISRN